MRLSTIEFTGYRRFENASCNVDGRTVAFIGPNESGKTSVLRGLEWLTARGGRAALPLREQNRRTRPDDDTLVVRARYRLDPDDIVAMQSLNPNLDSAIDLANVTEFRLSRRKDGTQVTGITTSLGRNLRPFIEALDRLDSINAVTLELAGLIEEEGLEGLAPLLEKARSTLDPSDQVWGTQRVDRLNAAIRGVQAARDGIAPDDSDDSDLPRLRHELDRVLVSLRAAAEAGALPDPLEGMRQILVNRVPRFILFSDEDRQLNETYNLSDAQLRSDPPAPLRNLLAVGGSTVEELWAAISGGDSAAMRTLERRVNLALRSRLHPMWTQSELTIDLALNQGGVLEVNIQELDSPDLAVTPIAERSDGLRAFLSLVCFLIAAELDVPPVLLIDEAERNLHYDAQADLVRVLTRELNVHKVIYTTHSPGCLPLDLGTGIRVVARDPIDQATSTIQNNFWTDDEPGFSRLLFAMGAEAAAFSSFRRAVLAEGASEMILLPTLLRNATDGSELDFQVAFGLSNLSVPKAMSSVALITAFLVDGDQSGNEKRQQLIDAGVSERHVFQLPNGKAIEDLVDRATYMAVVNEFLAEQGKRIVEGGLADGVTIARAVDDYAKVNLGLPRGVSHKIIATRLALLGEDLALDADGREFLVNLRQALEEAFARPYVLGQADA